MNISFFKTAMLKHCSNLNIFFDNIGYVGHPTDNLINSIDNWIEIKNELELGQGNELKPDKNGVIKFNAIHSSAALCVNNFSFFKKHINSIEFFGHSKFYDSIFEKKISTGISTPNLDFYLESNDVIIGIESKFTEFFSKKLPNHKDNLSKYVNRKKLEYLESEFQNLIVQYRNSTHPLHLDVAQLLKHSMALLNYNKSRKNYINLDSTLKPVLVYIFWEPKNANEYSIFETHRKEIEVFSNEIKDFIDFKSISYPEFWDSLISNEEYASYLYQIKERYDFKL